MKVPEDDANSIARTALFAIDHRWYESYCYSDQPLSYVILVVALRLIAGIVRAAVNLQARPLPYQIEPAAEATMISKERS